MEEIPKAEIEHDSALGQYSKVDQEFCVPMFQRLQAKEREPFAVRLFPLLFHLHRQRLASSWAEVVLLQAGRFEHR